MFQVHFCKFQGKREKQIFDKKSCENKTKLFVVSNRVKSVWICLKYSLITGSTYQSRSYTMPQIDGKVKYEIVSFRQDYLSKQFTNNVKYGTDETYNAVKYHVNEYQCHDRK